MRLMCWLAGVLPVSMLVAAFAHTFTELPQYVQEQTRADSNSDEPAFACSYQPGEGGGKKNQSLLAAEAKHYQLLTVPLAKEVVLEVGGLAFRPDGKLLPCATRGGVWNGNDPGSG